MSLTVLHPDLPVTRLWRPGYPLRPRCSGFRRLSMLLLLVFLGGIIGSYMLLTDSNRVRHQTEAYLTSILGGPVSVGRASLSIFDGLTLSHVTVRTTDAKTPDAVLLVADSFSLELDPAALFHGRLAASRLIVSGPHVRLVENVDNGTWNYQPLIRTLQARHKTSTGPSGPAVTPPQIVLRDAEVQYSEIRGSHYAKRGTLSLEGRLWPSPDGSRYSFELQSTGPDAPASHQLSDDGNLVASADPGSGGGPVLSGQVRLADGTVDATLTNLRFGHDIEAMLPSQVRDWWDAHQIQGRLNIPAFHYAPPSANQPLQFSMETTLDHVRLVVPFQELSGGSVAAAWARREKLLDTLRATGADLAGTADQFDLLTTPPPIPVDDVSGSYHFDQDGITLNHILGRISQDLMSVSGKIDGYSPDSPMHVRISSAPGQPFILQQDLPLTASLPQGVLKIYDIIRPHGTGSMWLQIDRPTRGSIPQVTGQIRVDDGGFTCKFYPYPVSHAHGIVAFVNDPETGYDRVEFRNIHGFGLPGGPNAGAGVTLNGWVGPFDRRVGCEIHILADSFAGEPALFTSLPKPIAAAVNSAWADDPAHPGQPLFPQLHGNVKCDVTMPIGVGTKPAVAVDLDLDDVEGKLAAFTYPLRHLRGHLAVRSDHLDFTDASMTTPSGATVTARVAASWKAADNLAISDLKSQIWLTAHDLPIDADLLGALSPDQRNWLTQAGVTGRIDVNGTAQGTAPDASNPTTASASTATASNLDYDLHLHLHDAAFAPPGKLMHIDAVAGNLHLTANQLTIEQLTGHRADAAIAAKCAVDFTTANPTVTLTASATNLPLDAALHQALPASARDPWDALAPAGNIDAELTYTGPEPDLFDTDSPATAPTTAPAALGQYTLTMRPRNLSVHPHALPYTLTDCHGAVTVTPTQTKLENVTASHGSARFAIDGVGVSEPQRDWDLRLSANNVPIDADLRSALPAAIATWINRAHLRGNLDLQLSRLHYHDAAANNKSAALALRGSVHVDNAQFNAGVPVENLTATATGDALLVGDHLEVLQSHLDLDRMDLARRPIRNLSAEVTKPGGDNTLHLDNINGELAGGRFAGTLTAVLPPAPSPTYTLDAVLKNADVGTIAGPDQDLRGQLSASLAMQGQWNDVATRRGRGDVVVTGQSLYQIPLLLGLWDVTNLALPNTSPFNQATARYNVDGKRVTFEQVTMRSDNMVMSGNGFLDFGTKQVRMNFGTDNPNWPKLPFIHDLVQGAQSELMRIQIRGTVQEPKVTAAPLHTFTTTVDQVLGGATEEK